MRFTLKNLRFLQYIDYQNVRKTEFFGCQSQEIVPFVPFKTFLWNKNINAGHLVPCKTFSRNKTIKLS